MYNTPNYTEQGGAKTVIGGEIDVTGTLKLDGDEVAVIPAFSLSTATTVSGIKTDFNLLLNAMSSAGLIKAVT
jgi:hypothetical protein